MLMLLKIFVTEDNKGYKADELVKRPYCFLNDHFEAFRQAILNFKNPPPKADQTV